MDFIIFLALLAIGYGTGSFLEKRHYERIREREKQYLHIPILTTESDPPDEREVQAAMLVSGNAVISIDYFKRIFSALQKFIGGRVTAYETLVDRARREAVLRMIEDAGNVDIIENVRVETSAIGRSANKKNTVGSVEALAYGTAIRYVQ